MTADSQHRLPAHCRACGELFWVPPAPVPKDVPCPSCAGPVPVPAGRFVGVRNLVAFGQQRGPHRLERLEDSLTRLDRNADEPADDEFVGVRRALNSLDAEQSAFWRQALLTVIAELAKEPQLPKDDATMTVVARRVVQIVMSSRSFEPRGY